MEVKINNNGEMLDATIEMVEGVMVVSPKEVKFEPKDGDVVTDGDGSLFIYKESLNGSNVYVIVKENLVVFKPVYTYNFYRFATEEEKQELFDKLTEEGYEWKAETKELVKLKWKPKEGELYFSPIFSNIDFLFSTCAHIYTGHFTDEMTVEKMGAFRTKDECQLFCDKLNQTIEEYKP